MLKFDNWALIADGKLLARERDNLTTTLLVSGDLPQGWAWDLLITAGQNRNIIRLEEMTGGVGVVLTAEMLAEQGYYRMQLRGTRGEEVRHTNITSVYVGESMSGDKMWPTIPSEFTQLEARVNADADRAEDAAQAAEDAAVRQPYPNPDTGTWWTWDADTGAYTDTGEPYSGGGSGEAGQDGGYYAPSVDDDGNLTWTPSKDDMPQVEGANIKGPAGPQGPAGADGKDGAQGPQGEQGVQGPPGEKGDTGPQGEKGDKGDTGAQGPKGDTGETGPAGQTGATPNLQIGEVTTLDAGSDATASITGTPENPLLNLGIPKGADGAGGSGGASSRLLRTITISEEISAIEFDEDDEGNPFSVQDLLIYAPLNVIGTQAGQFHVLLNDTFKLTSPNSAVSTTAKSIVWISYWLGMRYAYMGFTPYDYKDAANTANYCRLGNGPEKITKIKLSPQYGSFQSGTFYIYGR